MSKICLCLTAADLPGLLRQAGNYRGSYDLAELRVDLVAPEERPKLKEFPGLLRRETGGTIPMILTIRLPEDGGRWGRSGENEAQREELFQELLSTGEWTWVDLEANRRLEIVEKAAGEFDTAVIRSIHDFDGTLLNRPVAELAAMVRGMGQRDAIPKVAAKCTGSRQLLSLARLGVALSDVPGKVLLGMDEWGGPSRILAEKFGSLWTYASAFEAPEDPVAAPGQFDPRVLQDLYRFCRIDAESPVYAVVGNPIVHSRSPEIHNRWLQRAELPGTYIAIRSDDLGAAVETCDLLGITGLSVTVPHKEKALQLCDYAGHLARSIGAANTLVRAGDGWRARNTDVNGFLAPLRRALSLGPDASLAGRKFLIVGAGGAARAAVHGLVNAGAQVVVLNRTVKKAQRLAAEVKAEYGPLARESLHFFQDVDVVVQTTTVGMHPSIDDDPLPWWNPAGTELVFDMIYEPAETTLLRRARESGVAILNGSGMLEAQAALQFEIFTGIKAPI